MFGETRPPAQRHPRHPETQPGHQMPQRRRRVRGSHIFTFFDRCVAGSLFLLLRKCQGSGCAWGREQCPCKQSRKYGKIIISLSKLIESLILWRHRAPPRLVRESEGFALQPRGEQFNTRFRAPGHRGTCKIVREHGRKAHPGRRPGIPLPPKQPLR